MLYVGTAGWSIPAASVAHFPALGTHLSRYAQVFSAVEINSSFYKPHRRSTYERWAASVPQGFRFSVKVPKHATHSQRLREVDLTAFLEQCGGLGDKLGALLVQLPPSLAFERDVADEFFGDLRNRFSGRIAFEPRHRTWFEHDAALGILERYRVARVAADPPRHERDGVPAGNADFSYIRLHGTPRVYYSAYDPIRLDRIANDLRSATVDTWCIFDNTALGHATSDALSILGEIAQSRPTLPTDQYAFVDPEKRTPSARKEARTR